MTREFHVSRAARVRYGVDDALFALSGNVVLADLRAVRALATALDRTRPPERAVGIGQLNALGLVDEILHAVVALYREQRDPRALADALVDLETRLGRDAVEATLRRFTAEFPPLAVHRREIGVEAYLASETDGVPNREVALEELANLWLANANTAALPFAELFDDTDLAATTAYRDVIAGLARFFAGRSTFGPDGQDLLTMLRAPAVAEPRSLSGQLRWIRDRWGDFLAEALGARFGALLDRLIVGLDVAAEEDRAFGLRGAGPGGGLVPVTSFGGQEAEPERFSMDLDWMPRVVILARSTYVWLDQLSRAHGREIRTLDAIPDEELATLARRGFTGLWLIGLWERSRASERIKRRRGNPDAVASAYSLLDYRIAEDLGGERAYGNLRDRAWRHGIRLASDMVPNHMGIDSRWLIEHPDWFLSLDYPPYPGYRFDGPDLSDDGRVGIFIEDHYYDSSDAAVVFKRLDRATGSVRYVYHGNDGTSMPWNDTAQLDYARADVREAVIQTILAVARRFPIIRFDAAMTLAKRHVQRLWYPEPGSGGGIPSRAEHGMTKAAFEAAMPVEFWREVVDRVAAEVPDTLLLAEAFWLMEGYFVRTLGMHRVYNSAFMNMLRDERNAEYRLVVKNTLEFDPEILKRYVNFMNNPDERTAVDQFGTGDKYFGIATLMVTLPGLPMVGHGQVEGYAEKYGMEFRRAYWDERPNEGLVARHEHDIFPLLHRRRLFAEVRDFTFYDVLDDAGYVNEDVFAYSNRAGDERSLVVYHNRFASMRGRIRDSVGFAEKTADGGRNVVRRSLAEGLGLPGEHAAVAIARDPRAGLDFLWEVGELREHGFPVALDAYGCRVLLDWRIVPAEAAAEHRALAAELGGSGVPSVDAALAERRLRPIHDAVRILVNAHAFGEVIGFVAAAGPKAVAAAQPPAVAAVQAAPADAPEPVPDPTGLLDWATGRCWDALKAVRAAAGVPADDAALASIVDRHRCRLAAALRLVANPADDTPPDVAAACRFVGAQLGTDPAAWGTLLGWLAFDAVGGLLAPAELQGRSRAWFDRNGLGRVLADALRGLGLDEGGTWWTVDTVRHLLARPGESALSAPEAERPARLVRAWLADEELGRWLGLNRYDGRAYVNRESFERALGWLVVLVGVDGEADPARPADPAARDLAAAHALAVRLGVAAEAAGYAVGRLVELVAR